MGQAETEYMYLAHRSPPPRDQRRPSFEVGNSRRESRFPVIGITGVIIPFGATVSFRDSALWVGNTPRDFRIDVAETPPWHLMFPGRRGAGGDRHSQR